MAEMPERIWAGESDTLGTEWWNDEDTGEGDTPYIRADLVDDLVKALERFNRGGTTLFGDEEDVPVTFKGKDFRAIRAALARIKEAT